jgi:hypothetical protein
LIKIRAKKKEKEKMKLAIVGSRTFTSYDFLLEEIVKCVKREEIDEIVSGGAEGVDTLAERLSLDWKIPLTVFKPNYKEYKIKGNKIYYDSTLLIANHADTCFAIWENKSAGTQMTIDLFRKLGKLVYITEI